MNATDEQFLRRAIRMAMNGRGRVEPNPMVGCVIVQNGRVIGEGHTSPFGGPHAEPNALRSCTESPAGATVYVTMEPCCHTNKKTPPCAPRLIEAKVSRVFYGCLDPNPLVNGNGVAMLRVAGIEVIDPSPAILGEAKQLIAPFTLKLKSQRPYVTLKWAESADGKVAGPGRRRVQISNAASMRKIHEMRARCDAILVSGRTVAGDDPMLTAREVEPLRTLTRCVLDRGLTIPPQAKLVRTAEQSPTIIYCDAAAISAQPDKANELQSRGVTLSTASDFLADLHARGVTHLLVEPGPTLAAGLFKHPGNVVDRVWIFRSDKPLPDRGGLSAAVLPNDFKKTAELNLAGDVLSEYVNQKSETFYAATPSADFVLAAAGAR